MSKKGIGIATVGIVAVMSMLAPTALASKGCKISGFKVAKKGPRAAVLYEKGGFEGNEVTFYSCLWKTGKMHTLAEDVDIDRAKNYKFKVSGKFVFLSDDGRQVTLSNARNGKTRECSEGSDIDKTVGDDRAAYTQVLIYSPYGYVAQRAFVSYPKDDDPESFDNDLLLLICSLKTPYKIVETAAVSWTKINLVSAGKDKIVYTVDGQQKTALIP